MPLANMEFAALSDKIKDAVSKEAPLIGELRQAVQALQVKPLGTRPCRTIAPVATDGGENRLSFEPLNLEIIRVVDSNGVDLVQEIIPLSEDPSGLESCVQRIPELQKLLDILGVPFGELSYFLGGHASRADADRRPDLRAQVRSFRDVVEWAVLLDLATRDWPVQVLLLRDGLLRSKTFKRTTFPRLDRAFRAAFESQAGAAKKRVFLLGVAKTSAVLSKLSLALLLQGTFDKEYPCYAEVPRDLEEQCYNFDRTWMDTAEDQDGTSRELYQSFGRLYLVKLSPLRTAPILPVDVPIWLPPRDRQTVIEYLSYDAQETFPSVGYPNCLQKAHDFAVMTGLEMTALGDLLVHHLLDCFDVDIAEKILRHVNLGRGLVKGGARHGG